MAKPKNVSSGKDKYGTTVNIGSIVGFVTGWINKKNCSGEVTEIIHSPAERSYSMVTEMMEDVPDRWLYRVKRTGHTVGCDGDGKMFDLWDTEIEKYSTD